MLSGSTAEKVGEESLGIELVDPSYFFTEDRWREHRRELGLPEEPFPPEHTPSRPAPDETFDQLPTGTVALWHSICEGVLLLSLRLVGKQQTRRQDWRYATNGIRLLGGGVEDERMV